MRLRKWWIGGLVAAALAAVSTPWVFAEFSGLDRADLEPVRLDGDWGLQILVLDVGQADAILMLTPNGDSCLIDSGDGATDGRLAALHLSDQALNGIGRLKTLDLLISSHYDRDHIGGLPALVEEGIRIRKALDQGPSGKRTMTTAAGNPTTYSKYCTAVGDLDGDNVQDANEPAFARHMIHFGHIETMGRTDDVEIECVAVRGDTAGADHDVAGLDPATGTSNFDENPGSVALVVRLGEFEFFTAGDQTGDDWKSKPACEEAMLDSGAIRGGNDVDVLKASHHGSDTSTSAALASQMRPEVAIISTKFTKNHKLPKKVALQQLEENRAFVLITGEGRDPDTGEFADASTSTDDSYVPEAVFENQGTVRILVSRDGSRYTVFGGSFVRTFSSVDSENQR